MEVGWSSTLFAGCESERFDCFGGRADLMSCRLCLRKLGVIKVEDDRAIVIKVFWK